MFDAPARRLIDPILDPIAGWLARRGVSANAVTVGGFVVGMAGCVAIACRAYDAALVLILANRVADGFDGAIARRTGATDLGGFLDGILDTIFYSGVPFAFAVGRPEFALPAIFLVYSFVGTGGSFLVYAAIRAKRGATAADRGKKSFVYHAGLMEGTETIVFFVAFCLWPDRFPVLAWVFGGLCWVTTAMRILAGVAAFRGRPG